MANNVAYKNFVLITGCSKGGLGYALAEAFVNKGYFVFATARDPSKARDLLSHSDRNNIRILSLDVTSQESINDCFTHVEAATAGRGLNVLVNNAGIGYVMPLLDTSIEESKRLFEINVWGMLAVTQKFSPLLIDAKGTILNISSLAGAVRMAWQGVYNSSKASLTFLSETLRIEMKPFGVRVVTAMVGEVATEFYAHTQTSSFSLPKESLYQEIRDIIGKQSRGELQVDNETAESTAYKIVEDVVAGKTGQIWHGGVAGTAKYASWLLPSRLFEWILHRGRGVYDLKSPVSD
ncbi:hypothetical protein BD289DRAFT_413058 [Coniella lustricola]|uniref:Short-chain dehydrogenase/reductase n=1 Tax=Coniella lustricola TaxID=2025994 RepID=A0A2T3A258_9PEZI|nr:hypothetical protein BD289DRAFT_413058 [Coniella lustricola]